jgi:hypothetical protein
MQTVLQRLVSLGEAVCFNTCDVMRAVPVLSALFVVELGAEAPCGGNQPLAINQRLAINDAVYQRLAVSESGMAFGVRRSAFGVRRSSAERQFRQRPSSKVSETAHLWAVGGGRGSLPKVRVFH